MTRYDDSLPGPVAFDDEPLSHTLADVLEHGRPRASCTSPRPRSTRT